MDEKYYMLIDLNEDGFYHLEEFSTIEEVDSYLKEIGESDYERILIKGSKIGIKKIFVVDKQ